MPYAVQMVLHTSEIPLYQVFGFIVQLPQILRLLQAKEGTVVSITTSFSDAPNISGSSRPFEET